MQEDKEEEDWFATDTDEEEDGFVPSISHQLARKNTPSPLLGVTNSLKRKRPFGISPTPRHAVKPKPKAAPLGQLVDYDEDDSDPESGMAWLPKAEASTPTTPSDSLRSSPSLSPKSPAHELPPVSLDTKGAEDVKPGEAVKTETIISLPPRPKRQRSDDDDDELMERLTKTKRQDQSGMVTRSRPKPGDDPPMKKFKVKLGKLGVAPAPTSGVSEPDSKDGEKG
jgi:protein phosphatase 4 regulatory subunit 3